MYDEQEEGREAGHAQEGDDELESTTFRLCLRRQRDVDDVVKVVDVATAASVDGDDDVFGGAVVGERRGGDSGTEIGPAGSKFLPWLQL